MVSDRTIDNKFAERHSLISPPLRLCVCGALRAPPQHYHSSARNGNFHNTMSIGESRCAKIIFYKDIFQFLRHNNMKLKAQSIVSCLYPITGRSWFWGISHNVRACEIESHDTVAQIPDTVTTSKISIYPPPLRILMLLY